MKNLNKISHFFLIAIASVLLFSCSEDDDNMDPISTEPEFSGTYMQDDQKARPAINTVFVAPDRKDEFNTTTPSNLGNAFAADFESRLLALNPGYSTNALGLDAATFTSVLATDILTVSTVAPTTFFDGTNVLTGRTLADDVIDIELLLIFGGPDGSENPGLTSDNVDENDISFSNTFPYLASPW